MLQQPASCVRVIPLRAHGHGVAEQSSSGRGSLVRAARALDMSMCTITVQRVDDVDREQLLAPQAVETMACRLAEGRLVYECDRRAAWDVKPYARGSPGAG